MKRLVLLLAFAAGACGDSLTHPEPQKTALTSELRFLQFHDGAFAAAQKSASFWAVKGRDTEVELRYADGGEDFLEFEVDRHSLETRPDGSAIAYGDSVLITVTVDANKRFVFTFEPSGLRFNSAYPARLTLNYGRTNHALFLVKGVWRHDSAGLPWFSIPTFNQGNNTVRADVPHFTEFGMAEN